MGYKVSVIVPVYRTERYLRKCLDSILNQTLNDIEIILVDNGSSLEEKNIISEYTSCKNLSVISFSENQGYGKALNTAIAKSSGEYIGIVESDDFIEHDMYEVLYNKAFSSGADVVKTSYIAFNNLGSENPFEKLSVPVNTPFTLAENSELLSVHPSIWSCIYKREFLLKNNINFLEKAGTGWVDNPFQVETLLKAQKIVYIDKPLYNYRIDTANSSSSLKEGLDIPLNISRVVVAILEQNSVKNCDIWRNLQLREFSYVHDMILRSKLCDISLCANYIKEFLPLFKTEFIHDKNKAFYDELINSNTILLILKYKFKNFIKNVFSIKFSKKSKEIKLFGNRYVLIKRSV